MKNDGNAFWALRIFSNLSELDPAKDRIFYNIPNDIDLLCPRLFQITDRLPQIA